MERYLLNHGWEFCLCEPDGKPGRFSPVDIPHDWLIYDAENLYKDGDGHYRREIDVTDAGLNYVLRFEGVYQDCTVYLNGREIFEWKYGYTTFDVPLSGIKSGRNTVEVLVRHRHPNSRWYSGAGIYRNVWLIIKEASEILPDGVYVTPKKTDDGFITEIDTEVKVLGEAALEHILYHAARKFSIPRYSLSARALPKSFPILCRNFAR